MLLADAAQTLPDPNTFPAIGWLFVCFGAIALILNQGADFINRFRTKEPSPPLHKEYATKVEHDGLRVEFASFRDEVRVSFDEAADTSRQSREKIYNELRRHGEMIIANTTLTNSIAAQVGKLDDKFDAIISRAAKL